MFVHHMRAPLGRRHPDHNKYAVVLRGIKAKPVGGRPMDGPALTAPARAGPLGVWVGAKKRLPGRTKKLKDEKMDRTLGAPP